MSSEGTRDFLLADLGEGLEEATIIRWLVQVGDTVELNQTLCIVETAKAEVEVPSPYSGVVAALGGEEGETIAVGSLLARVAPTSGVADPPAGPSSEDPGSTAASSEGDDGPSDEAPKRQPTLVGYGHDASIDRSRRGAQSAGAGTGSRTATRTRPGAAVGARRRGEAPRKPITKPPVRLLARRLGIDLDDLVPGSGPGGVVTRADVEAAAEARPTLSPDRVDTSPERAPADGTTIPVRGVRARIAERMARSRTEIPDATATVVADCSRLLEVRESLNAMASRQGLDPLVTPFSLLCSLVVQSLQTVPILNSTFDEAGPEIRVHNDVHLGIGAATDRGLVVAVVHDADRRSVHDLSTELARLVEGARQGSLTPAELTGSTFTISNFGALGLDDGVPIVNHPEAAILGVGSIRRRPHVVDDEVVARPTASLTLAFDHRVCDGAEAARFLTGLRELVEAPELALLRS